MNVDPSAALLVELRLSSGTGSDQLTRPCCSRAWWSWSFSPVRETLPVPCYHFCPPAHFYLFIFYPSTHNVLFMLVFLNQQLYDWLFGRQFSSCEPEIYRGALWGCQCVMRDLLLLRYHSLFDDTIPQPKDGIRIKNLDVKRLIKT